MVHLTQSNDKISALKQYLKICAAPQLLLALIGVVTERPLVPIEHEPPPGPAVQFRSSLVQESLAAAGVDQHVRTQHHLVACWCRPEFVTKRSFRLNAAEQVANSNSILPAVSMC